MEYWAIAGPDAIRRFDECKAYQLRFSWLHPGIVLRVVIGVATGVIRRVSESGVWGAYHENMSIDLHRRRSIDRASPLINC